MFCLTANQFGSTTKSKVVVSTLLEDSSDTQKYTVCASSIKIFQKDHILERSNLIFEKKLDCEAWEDSKQSFMGEGDDFTVDAMLIVDKGNTLI